jgi:hypothetical protein
MMSPSPSKMSPIKILGHSRPAFPLDVYFRRKDSSNIAQAGISHLTSKISAIVLQFRRPDR